MAERRMFAKSIIGSARFLRMPPTSRLLYYNLGMAADDDGIVEAFSVMRTTGATEDDLRVLASKEFVHVLNEDLVTYITDWERNNYIQKDRYRPSVYAELLVKLGDGNTVDTVCIQDVSRMDTQVRLGKDRLGKVREGECEAADKPPRASRSTPAKPARKSYGQYGWVKLSDEEYSRLSNDLGQAELERCIAYIDESAQSTGNKNKWRDWNLVIRRCHRDRWGLGKGASKPNAKPVPSDEEYLKSWGEIP